jgi:hypothetical protein
MAPRLVVVEPELKPNVSGAARRADLFPLAERSDDRGVELPLNVKGEAAKKVVNKLIRAGFLEEVGAAGSLPVWRRDAESGPRALRITKNGLEAIAVEAEAEPAPQKASADPVLDLSH